jgi:GNAT superfamily N-acetyltransferase
MEISVREALLEDADAVQALVNAAFEVEKGHFKEIDRLSREETLEHFATGRFLLAEDVVDTEENAGKARLAACVYVEMNEGVGYFGLLAVDPARQRGGLGRRMALEAEQWCLARGCRVMDLVVVNLRLELQPIYRRMGYRVVGSEPAPNPERFTQAVEFVRMRKDLQA